MRIHAAVAALVLLCANARSVSAAPITFTDSDIPGLTITLENTGLISGTTYGVLLTVQETTSYTNQGDTALADILMSLSFNLSDTSTDATLGLYNAGTGTVWTASDNKKQNSGNGECNASGAGSTCLHESFNSSTSLGNLFLTPSANATYTWNLTVDLLGGSFGDTTSVKAFIADLYLKCTGPPAHQTCSWETKKAELFEASVDQSLTPDTGSTGGTSTGGTSTGGTSTGGTSTGSPGTPGDVSSVPEPASLILLGSGLVYVGARLRRRR